MRQIKYFCNLCGVEKPKDKLKCMYWDSTVKNGDSFGAYVMKLQLDSSDKHICLDCINFIKSN